MSDSFSGYRNPIVQGVDNIGRFDQFDLYAGEGDIVTNAGRAADGVAIAQFQILSLDVNGRLIPYTAAEFAYASGTLTFTAEPAAADTLTINGVVITFIANGAVPVGAQVAIGVAADFSDVAANLAALINGTPDSTDPNTSFPVYGTPPLAGVGVTADQAAGVLTLSAIAPGAAGDVTLAISATQPGLSAAALAGGGAEVDIEPDKAIGIAAQACAAATPGTSIPYWTAGIFNHEVLGWPAALDTLAQRQRVFAGTTIGVRQLL